ncbi:hypothetical protein [Burkholderia sp. PR2]|uniref:hypothetical protein n=1 Tax=Burkholderia sp. PR2 TaxID=3448078 RepID=UPI00402A774F
MAKVSQELARMHAPRKGDGTVIDVIHEKRTGSSEGSAIQVGLNLNDAPVPARRYVADVGCVLRSRSEVKLIFGQEKIGTDDLRSMLIVQMSTPAARQFVESFLHMAPSLKEIAQTVGVEGEQLASGLIEPDQAVSFAANFCAAAIVGEEACLDFYHASPFSLRSVHIVKKLSVEPVVRVDLRLSLLVAVIDEMQRIETEITAIG